MKKVFKSIGVLLILTLMTISVVLGVFYKKDVPLEEIKAEYSLPNSQYVEVNGMPVHYVVDGTGTKDLVLLHGTGSSLHTWQQWVDLMKNEYRIIRLDLPGFGLTGPNPDDRYDIASYMVFLETFFDKMELGDFHLGGNSFGGLLAWNYALKSDSVDKLLLLNASGYERKGVPIPLGFKLAKNPITAPLMRHITPKSVVEKTVLDAFEDDTKVTDEMVDRYYDLLLREGNRDGMVGKSQQIKFNEGGNPKDIRNKTLIMWGDKDGVVPAAHAYNFHKDIKGSELVMYKRMGHLPMEEHAEQSARDVLEFLHEDVAAN